MSMQQATYIFLSSSFISETLDLIIAFHCVESSVLFTLVTQYPSETQIMSTVVKILMMSPSTSEKQLPFDLFLFCLSCLESIFSQEGSSCSGDFMKKRSAIISYCKNLVEGLVIISSRHLIQELIN